MAKSVCWLYATPGKCITRLIIYKKKAIIVFFRELAFQIYTEFERLSKYFNNVKSSVFFGGISIKKNKETLMNNCPHIVVGTPGRILTLVRDKALNTKHLKHFILDECDKVLDQLGKWSSSNLTAEMMQIGILDMRRDVQEIFKATPHEKQVMMFSATLPKEIRPVCKKFMNNVKKFHLSSQ